jgi:hypothetical protein
MVFIDQYFRLNQDRINFNLMIFKFFKILVFHSI